LSSKALGGNLIDREDINDHVELEDDRRFSTLFTMDGKKSPPPFQEVATTRSLTSRKHHI